MSDAAAPYPDNETIKRLREQIATWDDRPAPAELVELASKALKGRKSKRHATSRNKAYRAFADQLPADDPVAWFQLAIGVTGEAGCWATSRGGEVRELVDWCDECLMLMGEEAELSSERGRQWRSIKLGSTFERDLAGIIHRILDPTDPAGEDAGADETGDVPAAAAAAETTDATPGDAGEAPPADAGQTIPEATDGEAPAPDPTPQPATDEPPAAIEPADPAAPASPPPAPKPAEEPPTPPEPTPAPEATSAIEGAEPMPAEDEQQASETDGDQRH